MSALKLQDHHEISRVLLRYATGIDTRDWALFRSCFADEIEADYGEFGVWTRGDDICAAMQAMHAGLGPTLHRISNIVIDGAGEIAHSRAYVDVLLTSAAPGGVGYQGAGYYEDGLVKTDAGWRINRRKYVAIRLAQIPG